MHPDPAVTQTAAAMAPLCDAVDILRFPAAVRTPPWSAADIGARTSRAVPAAAPFPEFRPHPFVRGGHAQTLFGLVSPGTPNHVAPRIHNVPLDDGDAVVLHDDRPAGWTAGGPSALLVHGLTGCAYSPYILRIGRKLNERGVRTFRIDLRTCGASRGLAANPYHAGCSSDVFAAFQTVQNLCDGGPTSVLGFSLGGNIVLKMLGEYADRLPDNVGPCATVNPCVDLAACTRFLGRRVGRYYDQHFVKMMIQQVLESKRLVGRERILHRSRPLKRIYEFDEVYTAPVCGYGSAEEYYARCSAAPVLGAIRAPTLILAAEDDPLIPVDIFRDLRASSTVSVQIAKSGGHLGFIGRKGIDPDTRWMDWRCVDWVAPPAHVARIERSA